MNEAEQVEAVPAEDLDVDSMDEGELTLDAAKASINLAKNHCSPAELARTFARTSPSTLCH